MYIKYWIGTCYCLSPLLEHVTPVAISQKCNPQDKKALLQIKKELNNPTSLSSWNPRKNCCDWVFIHCDVTTSRVIWLAIQFSSPDQFTTPFPNPEFIGHISPSVGDLSYVERLEFNQLPNVTGQIPSTISKLKNLKYLTISGTSVSGPIPSFLGQFKNLELLDLYSNKLTGSIPSSLSQLTNLKQLFLHENKLSGHIPASLGQLNLERLALSKNRLVGDASVLFGSNKRTEYIDLSRNLFSFDFSKVDVPKKSSFLLDINHNNIYGKIPVGWTKVKELQMFNVSYNLLCGQIPQGGNLQTNFDVFNYYHNKCLCGSPLPKCK
ncbi:putative leucine-rich repeat-containing, plant-type, leucine-rich repeat domain, L [Medicago truncatula]|uniref:Leucine-rich repeat, plant specific n=1 Tax=Medicago truncatula TaxID=3880 RepID=A2Q4V4_MEDTR|nr:Leucine-rich repeat, plant specific [Medicago truncatula]AES81435.2 polygalacturonase inhibitor protein [Medicago truncatula]RHN47930.1 putative leucine-rich repeat-containing, plant-type, leucine-rich repeat domain, L [Medicago truncatula]